MRFIKQLKKTKPFYRVNVQQIFSKYSELLNNYNTNILFKSLYFKNGGLDTHTQIPTKEKLM